MTQTLKLSDDLMQLVWEDRKDGTCRLGRRDIQLGELKLEPTDGTKDDLYVNVTSVAYMRMKDVPLSVARGEGYLTVKELFERMQQHYPNIRWTDEVTVISWSLD